MKKIFLILILALTFSVYGQSPKIKVQQWKSVTEVEKNALVIEANTYPQIYNVDQSRFEYWDGSAWRPLGVSNIYTEDGTLTGTRELTIPALDTLSLSGLTAGIKIIPNIDEVQVTGSFNIGNNVLSGSDNIFSVAAENTENAVNTITGSLASSVIGDTNSMTNSYFSSVVGYGNTMVNGYTSNIFGTQNSTNLYYQTAIGRNNVVRSVYYANAIGVGLISNNMGMTAVGTANVERPDNGTLNGSTTARFVVGNGTLTVNPNVAAARSDAFEVLQSGAVNAPSLTPEIIDTELTGRTLLTREWFEANSIGGADNLGNHTATQDILLNGNNISSTADISITPLQNINIPSPKRLTFGDGTDGLSITSNGIYGSIYSQGAFGLLLGHVQTTGQGSVLLALEDSGIRMKTLNSGGHVSLRTDNTTGTHTIQFPDKSGTFALLDDVVTNTDSQTLSLAGTTLSISGGNSQDLASLQDGTGTDDQTATEVPITDSANNFTSTNVEGALAELAGASTSSSIIPVVVTDSIYTFLEADLLASKVHIFNVVADTIVATIPEITLPATELIVNTIKTINENQIKIIPSATINQVQYSPRVKGEAFSIASSTDDVWMKWDNVNSEVYTPPVVDPYGPELLDVSTMEAQTPATTTFSAGTWSFNATARYDYLRALAICEVGKTYKLEITVANYVSGNIRFNNPFGSANFTGNGTYVVEAVATNTGVQISTNLDGANTFDITSISVKELLP